MSAALLRQALLAAQVQAQQRQRMAALASATAGVGGDVNALINALLGPRDVNQAVDAWKLVSATSNIGASDAGGGADASAANPAATAAALFPGQMPNATTTNPLANLAALRALGGGFGVPGAATVANAPRGVPGGAPAMAGGFADDSAARAAILFGAASGIPAGGAYGVNPSPFGVAGAGAPRTSGADASVAAAAALAAKGGGGGDDEAVAAAAAAFFAAMNANTQNAAARNANAQNAVENAGTRGRDSGVSEDTDVGKEETRGGTRRDPSDRRGGTPPRRMTPRRNRRRRSRRRRSRCCPRTSPPPSRGWRLSAASNRSRAGFSGFGRVAKVDETSEPEVTMRHARADVFVSARAIPESGDETVSRGVGGDVLSNAERRTPNVERRTSNVERRTNDAFLRGKYNTGIRPSRFVARATSNARPILVRSKTERLPRARIKDEKVLLSNKTIVDLPFCCVKMGFGKAILGGLDCLPIRFQVAKIFESRPF